MPSEHRIVYCDINAQQSPSYTLFYFYLLQFLLYGILNMLMLRSIHTRGDVGSCMFPYITIKIQFELMEGINMLEKEEKTAWEPLRCSAISLYLMNELKMIS